MRHARALVGLVAPFCAVREESCSAGSPGRKAAVSRLGRHAGTRSAVPQLGATVPLDATASLSLASPLEIVLHVPYVLAATPVALAGLLFALAGSNFGWP